MIQIRRRITQLACGIALACLATAGLHAQDTETPDTAAGKRLQQMLSALEAKGEALETFLREGFENQDDDSYQQRKGHADGLTSQLGVLKLQRIIESDEHSVSARCVSENGPSVLVSLRVNEKSPHEINFIQLNVSEEGDSSDEPAEDLDANDKVEIVETLIQELKTKYVFPEVADKMCEDLQESLDKDAYQDVNDRAVFAQRLTDQLRKICNDKHLRIRPTPPRRPTSRAGRRQIDNHGFVKAEMLPGGIGYLKFNYFSGDPIAEKTAAAAMNFLANSEAIIFDLRSNGGGSPQMIAFLSGYIFDESVHLNSFYNRPTDTTRESWSRDDVPGDRFGGTKPIYVLTSERTFSGAEEFSYNLKNLKRGTIVGATTGGGAHPVMPVRLNNGFSMSMPFARAINPITKTNWEGVGVEPDVKVSADAALDTAIELAKTRLAKPDSTVTSGDVSAADLLSEANQLMGSQEFAKATKTLRQVVKMAPDNGQAWFLLGYCLHASGELDQAIEIHKKAAEYDRFTVIATYNLACAYSLQGKTDESVAALKSAIEKGFNDASQVESDTDFDNVRKDKRFVELLQEIGG